MSEQPEKRRLYVTMRLSPMEVEPHGPFTLPFPVKVVLPDGCAGVMYAFSTPEAAREWYGNDVQMVEIEVKA